jgi:superoxide dismutase, Cu-Zn family
MRVVMAGTSWPLSQSRREVRIMPGIRSIIVPVAVLALGGATVAFAGGRGDGDGDRGRSARAATATLTDAAGRTVARVWMYERRGSDAVQLMIRAEGLPPGFHGFHIHTTGRCDAPTFTTAGGHFNPSGATHGDHAGDLPSLLVNADGTATLETATDRFSIADLRDADGSAVMVHSGRDNFANIPARYGGPDQETLNTGDAGSRIACGVVR